MAETAPPTYEKERRASQTAVDQGLASEDDAAMLGMRARALYYRTVELILCAAKLGYKQEVGLFLWQCIIQD
jgi:hypothetical protein